MFLFKYSIKEKSNFPINWRKKGKVDDSPFIHLVAHTQGMENHQIHAEFGRFPVLYLIYSLFSVSVDINHLVFWFPNVQFMGQPTGFRLNMLH